MALEMEVPILVRKGEKGIIIYVFKYTKKFIFITLMQHYKYMVFCTMK